jgi:hypothetical protein
VFRRALVVDKPVHDPEFEIPASPKNPNFLKLKRMHQKGKIVQAFLDCLK